MVFQSAPGRGHAVRAFISDRLLITIGILAVLILTTWRLSSLRGSLVVYCAHDSIFAEQVLREFEQQSGIKVAAKYDTEATKSLGLVELLLAEKDQPRCDVFWNNELLGTADLAERGLFEPYKGPGWERIPAQWKDPEGRWTGFAGRLRVNIVSTRGNSERQAAFPSLEGATGDLSRSAIAKPLYGTTLTHYTVLWHRWGADKLKAWHLETRERGLREVNGNGVVRDLVAAGECDYGLTDTDDFFGAKDRFAPVTMTPSRLEDGSAILIPNTVAIVRGSARQREARMLTDFLLSAETELALARSRARQIPLGPVDEAGLSAEVRELREWSRKSVPLLDLIAARNECLSWLKSRYSP